jgi:plasmid maintenance system killer protein
MYICFRNARLRDDFNEMSRLRRRYGPLNAKQIGKRMNQLAAAKTLADMRHLGGGCHELQGDLKGQLALNLVGGWRLLFAPANNPTPRKQDGGLDWAAVTAVEILSVEDYH